MFMVMISACLYSPTYGRTARTLFTINRQPFALDIKAVPPAYVLICGRAHHRLNNHKRPGPFRITTMTDSGRAFSKTGTALFSELAATFSKTNPENAFWVVLDNAFGKKAWP
jgi:hypothetical protein